MRSYKMFKLIAEFYNIRILNATYGGKLELFNKIDYETLF